MPIADSIGASRNDCRSGRYAIRSTVQPYKAVTAIDTSSTTSRITGTMVSPNDTSTRNVMRAIKPPIMKISPWAKLIMPTMP